MMVVMWRMKMLLLLLLCYLVSNIPIFSCFLPLKSTTYGYYKSIIVVMWMMVILKLLCPMFLLFPQIVIIVIVIVLLLFRCFQRPHFFSLLATQQYNSWQVYGNEASFVKAKKKNNINYADNTLFA